MYAFIGCVCVCVIGCAQYARTQKNKATEGHLGLLKAKLAKLKRELLESSVRVACRFAA
jgi:ribosome-interacting GTPase 1